MRLVARLVLGAVLAGAPACLAAQPVISPATQPEISFQMERQGVAIPHFTIHVHEDGTGNYQAEEVGSPADDNAVRYAAGKHIDRAMKLSSGTVTKMFKAARELGYFKTGCESKKKNIANTGTKTLSYAGADGAGSCVYNYSDNRNVMMLTDMFIAIAYTMDEGRRLEYLHRYDRLGLDAETISLQDAVKMGRALELGTIAPVLESIASDMAVMERVRLRATKLLESTKDKV